MPKRLIPVIAALLLGFGASTLRAETEPPPADNTTLKFKKTLYVHKTENGKIFAETRKITSGDTIWRILREEYRVSEDLMVTLVDVFSEVNPGVNPNNLTAGQVVRVPFKIESSPGALPSPPKPADNYVVRPGDTLWKILKNVYGVKKEEMGKVMTLVSNANQGVKDINRLWVGQVIVMPAEVTSGAKKESVPQTPPDTEKKVGVPEYFTSVLNLLYAMGCTVDRSGETYIPVERGKTLRLQASDFPIVSGPGGKKVVLDPTERLSLAMRNALRSSWGYATLSSARADAGEYLSNLIPDLGFFEASQGGRSIPLGHGAMLTAQTSWSIVPTQKDLWVGRIHLLFPMGLAVDPQLASLALEKGFISHRIGTDQEGWRKIAAGEEKAASLDFSDPVEGTAHLLELIGIHANRDKEVDCRLDGGVTYRVRALLAFEYNKLSYAVPPAVPARAESLLTRSGYFTLPMDPKTPPMARIRDLFALLGIANRPEEVKAPATGALVARVEGLLIDNAFLADALYPPAPGQMGPRPPVLFTDAELEPRVVSALFRSGFLPVILK